MGKPERMWLLESMINGFKRIWTAIVEGADRLCKKGKNKKKKNYLILAMLRCMIIIGLMQRSSLTTSPTFHSVGYMLTEREKRCHAQHFQDLSHRMRTPVSTALWINT